MKTGMYCVFHRTVGAQWNSRANPNREATIVVEGWSLCDSCGISLAIEKSEDSTMTPEKVLAEYMERGFC